MGEVGKLMGADLTNAMLVQAEQRIAREGWSNVMLVQRDAAAYEFPTEVQGVLSTFALTLVPEYERVVENAADALAMGGRLVILDFRQPENWPPWLVRLGVRHPTLWRIAGFDRQKALVGHAETFFACDHNASFWWVCIHRGRRRPRTWRQARVAMKCASWSPLAVAGSDADEVSAGKV